MGRKVKKTKQSSVVENFIKKLIEEKQFWPLIVIASVIILTLVVLRPISVKLWSLKQDNKNQQKKLATLLTKFQQLESFDEYELEMKVKKLNKVLPNEKPVMMFLASVTNMARDKNLSLGKIELKPGEIYQEKKAGGSVSTTEKVQSMELSFLVSGPMNNISAFLEELEKTAPLMRVESLSFSLPEEGEEEGMKSILDIKVFYQFLPEKLGSVDSPLLFMTLREEKILAEVENYKSFETETTFVPVGKKNPFTLEGGETLPEVEE